MKSCALLLSLVMPLLAQDLFLLADGGLVLGRAEWTGSRAFLFVADAPARSIARGSLLVALPASADAAWRKAFALFREGRLEGALHHAWPVDAAHRIAEMPLERLHLIGRLALALGRGDLLERLAAHSFPALKGPLALDLLHWRLEHWMLEGAAKRAAAELITVEQHAARRELDEEERVTLGLATARAFRLAGATEEAARRIEQLLLAAESGRWEERRRLPLYIEADREARGIPAALASQKRLATLRTPEALVMLDVLEAEISMERDAPEEAIGVLGWREFQTPAIPLVRLALARARWVLGMAGDELRLAGARSELSDLARLGEDPAVAAAARRLLAGRY